MFLSDDHRLDRKSPIQRQHVSLFQCIHINQVLGLIGLYPEYFETAVGACIIHVIFNQN